MILIKQHNSHYVARLYSHLFSMAVDDYFYHLKLFPYLDYEFTAKTIQGVLYFGVSFHSKEAKGLEKNIQNLKISIADESLHVAIIQIGSVLGHTLGVVGKDVADWDRVREELLVVEETPWQYIKDVGSINPRTAKLVPGSLYVPQDKTVIPVRKINVTFALDKEFADDHEELLPLYNEVSELMSERVRIDLYRKFGFYGMGTNRKPKNRTLKLIHTFHIGEVYPLEMPFVKKAITVSLLDLNDFKAFWRLVAQLRDLDYNDPDKVVPGVNRTFRQTGLIVGEKGWRRIATEENCKAILAHMKVSIGAGHNRTSMDVASILL